MCARSMVWWYKSTTDVSRAMYLIIVPGTVLWFIYGTCHNDISILLANGFQRFWHIRCFYGKYMISNQFNVHFVSICHPTCAQNSFWGHWRGFCLIKEKVTSMDRGIFFNFSTNI
ncbi:SemiSWEET family transporter [Ulvibacterium sp.]|uniref:SemiSWEET family transporter n=1 Tax=Ulvibacterium sp. TaxID=2665914 RepID=UPI003BAD1492